MWRLVFRSIASFIIFKRDKSLTKVVKVANILKRRLFSGGVSRKYQRNCCLNIDLELRNASYIMLVDLAEEG